VARRLTSLSTRAVVIVLAVHFKSKQADDPDWRLAEAEHTRQIADQRRGRAAHGRGLLGTVLRQAFAQQREDGAHPRLLPVAQGDLESALELGLEAVQLEAKFKRGRERGKLRIPVDFSGRVLSGLALDDSAMPDVGNLLRSQGVDYPGLLFPAFRIDYRRMRFVEPATRANLCLDYDIHVPCSNRRLVHRHDPRRLDRGVFEIKGRSAELPPALRPLIKLGCRKQSFSKYLACYERLTDAMA